MAREKSEKLWIAGGVGACLLVAAGAWMFAVSPALSDADSVRSQAADVATQNLALQSNVSRLQQQYAHIGKLRAQLAQAQEALPSGLNMSQFTDQLNKEADQNHVKVTSVSAAPPAAFGSSAAAAPASTDASSSAAPAAATSAAPASGIFAIPIILQVAGSQQNDLSMLHAIQRGGPRAALVTGTQFSTDPATKGSTTMTVDMSVFVNAAPAPTAATPAAGATPSPTPSSSS